MEQNDEQRSPDDELVLELLSAGFTHVQVAARCNISTKTIQRRLRDPSIAADLTERRRQRVASIARRLVHLADHAVDALSDALASENEHVRLQAARAVLDLGRRHHREELVESELDGRVTEIESRLRASEREGSDHEQ